MNKLVLTADYWWTELNRINTFFKKELCIQRSVTALKFSMFNNISYSIIDTVVHASNLVFLLRKVIFTANCRDTNSSWSSGNMRPTPYVHTPQTPYLNPTDSGIRIGGPKLSQPRGKFTFRIGCRMHGRMDAVYQRPQSCMLWKFRVQTMLKYLLLQQV